MKGEKKMTSKELNYHTAYWFKPLEKILHLTYIHHHTDGTKTYNFEDVMTNGIITLNEELLGELEYYYKGE